jgi:hypothetical protein
MSFTRAGASLLGTESQLIEFEPQKVRDKTAACKVPERCSKQQVLEIMELSSCFDAVDTFAAA